jgi:hypothetical protein
MRVFLVFLGIYLLLALLGLLEMGQVQLPIDLSVSLPRGALPALS